jgi:CheY-like chemotaxis protein
MDGFEVAKRLQDAPGLEHTRVVALTGHGDEAHRRRARERGIGDYLLKPVDIGALRQVLDEAARGPATERAPGQSR